MAIFNSREQQCCFIQHKLNIYYLIQSFNLLFKIFIPRNSIINKHLNFSILPIHYRNSASFTIPCHYRIGWVDFISLHLHPVLHKICYQFKIIVVANGINALVIFSNYITLITRIWICLKPEKICAIGYLLCYRNRSFWYVASAPDIFVIFLLLIFHEVFQHFLKFFLGNSLRSVVETFINAGEVKKIGYVLLFVFLFYIEPECMTCNCWFIKGKLIKVFVTFTKHNTF